MISCDLPQPPFFLLAAPHVTAKHLQTSVKSRGRRFLFYLTLLIFASTVIQVFSSLQPRTLGRRPIQRRLQDVGKSWEVRRDQMILPAARIVTPSGKKGSAFVVSQSENGTYVLTNHHIIEDCIQQKDRWDPVIKSSRKVEQLLPVNVEVFRYDERGRHLQTLTSFADIVAYSVFGDKWSFEGDLALLKLRARADGIPAAKLIKQHTFFEEVRMLDDIVMVGCPDGSTIPLPTTGHVASLTEERAGVGLLLSHVFGNPGSSGSPVYRYSYQRGAYEIIAIHSMRDKSRGSLTDLGTGSFLRLGVQVPVIYDFLKRHGFEHLVAASDSNVLKDGHLGEKAAGTNRGASGRRRADVLRNERADRRSQNHANLTSDDTGPFVSSQSTLSNSSGTTVVEQIEQLSIL